MKKTKIASALLSLLLIFSLAACGEKTEPVTTPVDESSAATEESTAPTETPATTENRVVKLGVVGEDNLMWDPIIATLAEEGVTLELVKFSDYVIPNQALNSGEIDMNSFQHHAFLDNAIVENGYEIVAIGNTYIAPIKAYSKSITDVKDVKDGDKVAIPNDRTNSGRALKLLEAAGLITVDPEKGYLPEVRDITDNPHNLEIVEVEAANVFSLLDDVAFGIINDQFALLAGLSPKDDPILIEQIALDGNNPYINNIAVRIADKEDTVYNRIVELYQTDATEQILLTEYPGTFIKAW